MARPAYSATERERIETEIRQTAARLFGEFGYRNVSMRAIGRELNLSATALYRYYASKEALLAAIRAEGFRQLEQRLRAAQEGDTSAEAVVARAIRTYLDFALESRSLYSLMYELDQAQVTEDPSVAINRRAAFAQAEHIAQRLLSDAGRQGDPNELAHLFWIGAHGLAALALANQLDLGKDFTALVDPLLRTLLGDSGGT